MRIIKIVSNGIPIEIVDEEDSSLDEAMESVKLMMDSSKLVTIIGKNSAALVRPSSISAISVIDIPEPMKNKEQKNESVDMIIDIEG